MSIEIDLAAYAHIVDERLRTLEKCINEVAKRVESLAVMLNNSLDLHTRNLERWNKLYDEVLP